MIFRAGRHSEAVPLLRRALETLLKSSAARQAPDESLRSMTQNYIDALLAVEWSPQEIEAHLHELFGRSGFNLTLRIDAADNHERG